MDKSLIDLYRSKQINYNAIKSSCFFGLKDIDAVDVSIIIPVMDRENFHNPVVNYLKKAIKKCKEVGTFGEDKTFSITIVEHSETAKHRHLSHLNNINYIWIKKLINQPFNKCLSMNVGSLYSNEAKYYLFHDIDILMNDNYFIDIFRNLKRVTDNSALQTFAMRRVVLMTYDQTNSIINERCTFNDLTHTYSKPGAPGGSIFIKSEDFKNVGGYDAEFFHGYSPEDAFFWDKLKSTVNIQGCDNPMIEAYHMMHPPKHDSNPEANELMNIYKNFKRISHNEKLMYIKEIASKFKKYRI